MNDLDDLARNLPKLTAGGGYLLVIGDDGVILAAHDLSQSWFASTDRGEEARTLFAQMLGARPRAPLLVLADVLEQMVRDDHLPKVGPMDQAKLLKRRLDQAFPGDVLKGAISLGREPGGGRKVMLAGLPLSASIAPWVPFLESLPNPVTGFCLQPLEAVGLLDALLPKGGPWRALICRQATGGVRQIFTHHGRLVMSRLTQPLAPGSDLAARAQVVERELRSSISYLKRLGYADGDGLDLLVVTSEDLCAKIAGHELMVRSVTAITPEEAGRRVGLTVEPSAAADLLLAGWAMGRKRPALVLPTVELAHRATVRRLVRGMAAAAVLATLGVAGVVGVMAATYLHSGQELEQGAAELKALAEREAALHGGLTALPLPLAEMRPAAALAESWDHQRFDLTGLLAALPTDSSPQRVGFTANPPTAKGPAARWELSLSYDLGGKTALEQQVQRIRALRDTVAKAYPDCKVTVVRLPAGLQTGQSLDGSLGEGTAAVDRDALLVLLVRREN